MGTIQIKKYGRKVTIGTLYTEPFTLNATTTVKAIAIKDGVSSSVASRIFSKTDGTGDPEQE